MAPQEDAQHEAIHCFGVDLSGSGGFLFFLLKILLPVDISFGGGMG